MSRPLFYDVARCAGRMDFNADDTRWCDQRETCARYLSFSKWDVGVVPDYQRISVMMAGENCQHKIEVNCNE
jgi:hypothetical protein